MRKLNNQWYMENITNQVHKGVFACKSKQKAPPGWIKFDLSPKAGHAYVSLVTGDKVAKRPNEEACAYKAREPFLEQHKPQTRSKHRNALKCSSVLACGRSPDKQFTVSDDPLKDAV